MTQNSKFTLYFNTVREMATNARYPYSQEIHNSEDLAELVVNDHVCAQYKDHHRSKENYIESDCCMLDVDNTHSDDPTDWITPDDIHKAFRGVPFYVVYSRNHLKSKDGKEPRPKFHVYFPCAPISDRSEYRRLKEAVCSYCPVFDKNAKDEARFFFGVENPQVEYFPGETLLSDFVRIIEVDNADTIPQGQRNSHMCSFGARQLKRYGDEDGRAHKAFINESQKCLPLLDDAELTVIWNGAVSFYHKAIKADPDYVPPEEYNSASESGGAFLSKSEMLLKLFEDTGAMLFHDEVNEPFAAVPIDGHTRIWALDDGEFKSWLGLLYHKGTKKLIGSDAIKQVISMLSARAIFDHSEPIRLSVRVAEHEKAFYYDLTDYKWRAVKITAEGWTIEDKPPILFRRYRHQLAQVEPRKGGDVRKILRHINIKNDYHILFLCWLISCFVPHIPHVMPILHGEKGAAKTTACHLSREVIDPSKLDTITLENDQRTLVINLQQHWFLPFDNVSYLNEHTSDTLCRAITGGGVQQRKLYTNADDYIFTFKRCLAINGINNVATRPDLLDRAILIEVVRIAESERRELADVVARFEADRADILGGIFDTLSEAMRILPNVKLDKLPRMADFARLGYAIGEALGGYGEQFLAEYAANRDSQNIEVINSDPIATLVMAFMSSRYTWQGMVSGLLTELVAIAPNYGINPKAKGFPTQPNGLSRRLGGIKSNLEAVGISFEKHGDMRGMNVFIKNANSSPLPPYVLNNGKRSGFRNGDEMEMPKAQGNISQSVDSLAIGGYGGNGDYGDEIVTPELEGIDFSGGDKMG